MSKPEYPAWLPTNPVGDPTKIQLPSGPQRSAGYAVGSKPPAQWFNWLYNLVSQWLYRLGPTAPDAIIGAGAYCTHDTIELAIADTVNVPAGSKVVLADSRTVNTAAIALTVAWASVEALPGVTYTAGTATQCFSMQAAGIHIKGLRFVGFATAILAQAAWTYGRWSFCNFNTCTTEVDDTLAPAGKKPEPACNITE